MWFQVDKCSLAVLSWHLIVFMLLISCKEIIVQKKFLKKYTFRCHALSILVVYYFKYLLMWTVLWCAVVGCITYTYLHVWGYKTIPHFSCVMKVRVLLVRQCSPHADEYGTRDLNSSDIVFSKTKIFHIWCSGGQLWQHRHADPTTELHPQGSSYPRPNTRQRDGRDGRHRWRGHHRQLSAGHRHHTATRRTKIASRGWEKLSGCAGRVETEAATTEEVTTPRGENKTTNAGEYYTGEDTLFLGFVSLWSPGWAGWGYAEFPVY